MKVDSQDDVFSLLAEQLGRLAEAVEKLAAKVDEESKNLTDAKLEQARIEKRNAQAKEKQIATCPEPIYFLSELISGGVVYSIAESRYDRVFFKEVLGDWLFFQDVISGEEVKVNILDFNSRFHPIVSVFPYRQIGYKSRTGWENES